MPRPVTTVTKHKIHGGSALTTRGAQRVRPAYSFNGDLDLLSEDLGFRVFLNHRERVVPRAPH